MQLAVIVSFSVRLASCSCIADRNGLATYNWLVKRRWHRPVASAACNFVQNDFVIVIAFMHAAQRAPLHAKWMANASHLLHFVQSDGIAKREPTYCEHHTATTGGYDGTNYYLTLSDRTHCCWYIYRSDVCFCTAARLLHFTFEICVKHRHKHTHTVTHTETQGEGVRYVDSSTIYSINWQYASERAYQPACYIYTFLRIYWIIFNFKDKFRIDSFIHSMNVVQRTMADAPVHM